LVGPLLTGSVAENRAAPDSFAHPTDAKQAQNGKAGPATTRDSWWRVQAAGPAWADNPARPAQRVRQDLEPNTRGNAANSPGSPFNELGINSVNGDIGGQHYSPKSRYDVACFQQAQHNPR